MKTRIKFILMALMGFNVISCSTVTTTTTPTGKWSNTKAALVDLRVWHVIGKAGVIAAQNSGSFSFDWAQRPQNYSLSLAGPLGIGNLSLVGTPTNVTLTDSNGKTLQAKSAEALLAQITGWQLPIPYLNYWMRGLPVPSVPLQQRTGANGYPATFVQQGWRVDYLSYMPVGPYFLPSKLTITRPDLKVKIMIYDWKI